jgi:hypothetical protein
MVQHGKCECKGDVKGLPLFVWFPFGDDFIAVAVII